MKASHWLARVIHGLKSKPELNGRRGSLLSFDAVKQRWNVRVADQTIALRPINFDLEDQEEMPRPSLTRRATRSHRTPSSS